MKMRKIAVMIVNLGGPLTQDDVRSFLYNLFSDRYIITIPSPLRQAIAFLISTTRAKSAKENYAKMGVAHPLCPRHKNKLLP